MYFFLTKRCLSADKYLMIPMGVVPNSHLLMHERLHLDNVFHKGIENAISHRLII